MTMNNETQSINDLAVESLEGDKTIDLNKDVDYKIASSIDEEIKKGKKKDDFAIVAGIGCHAKIFDYINLNFITMVVGRVL